MEVYDKIEVMASPPREICHASAEDTGYFGVPDIVPCFPRFRGNSLVRSGFARIVLSQVIVLLVLILSDSQLHAQGGDEDKEMFNRAKQRDQQAIDEAVKSWWTASMRSHEQRIEWWREAKFGMFIHWGVYSLPGGEWKGKKVSGYAEHLMRKEKITRNEYMELAHQFNPVKFNAEQWILNAKKAGMKYFIITAKHHDGFAMYDSKVSTFDIRDQTPFKTDPLAELAAAAKKHGVKFGFYYSHAFDWEHPDAPGNDWEYNNPGGDKLIGGTNWYDAHPEWLPKAVKYVDEKAIPQIKELITKYHPDILWFDTPQKLPLSENIRILKAIRETDSTIVVNGRLVRSAGANFGDYKNTADRPAEFYPVNGDWEAIPTTNESYGYHKFDSSHKSVSHFIQLLAKAASKGGNLLMNIGPKGDGSFDQKDLDILNGIGDWMKVNGESIYGTTASPLPQHSWGVSTVKGKKLYLHVFNWPRDGRLFIGGMSSFPVKAYLLKNPSKTLPVEQLSTGDIRIAGPATAPDSVNTVIVLEYVGKLNSETFYCITPGAQESRLLAFDAVQQGTGFKYGDGKRDRYYVEGWQRTTQSLEWKLRVLKAGTYNLLIRYLAPEETSAGSFALKIDEDKSKKQDGKYLFKQPVLTTAKNTTVITRNIGIISLEQGTYTITMTPESIGKTELMKLLELQLMPLDK
jgi:alpha-L-fucosidase